MGLSLLFPLGLTALGAWLLPLLIHLARRQESRLTEFAALRWLRAQPKPRQRIRIDEWPLLFVRLLLLALVALLMAGLAWQANEDRRPRVLLSPGIDAQAQRALQWPGEARVQWLAPGFPALEAPAPKVEAPVTSLLREFDAQLPADAPLTVVVPADWGGADAQRPVLSRAVEWRVLPGRSPAAAKPAAPLRLAVFGFAADAPALRTLRALQAAWQTTPASLATSADDVPDRTLLGPGAVAVRDGASALPTPWLEWVNAGGELLLVGAGPWPTHTAARPEWQDDNGDVLLASAALGRGRIWRLPQGLDPAKFVDLLDARFPDALADHLRAPPSPARLAAKDFPPLHQSRQWPRPAAKLLPGLALLIALLFALERWMATSPRRGAIA